MMTHLVLLKPRAELTAADRLAFVAAFEHAVRAIPVVRAVRIGRRVLLGAGYERDMPDLADVVAALDFDDAAGVCAYLEHPAHAELGRHFGQSLRSALVYDFEVGGLELLARLAETDPAPGGLSAVKS